MSWSWSYWSELDHMSVPEPITEILYKQFLDPRMRVCSTWTPVQGVEEHLFREIRGIWIKKKNSYNHNGASQVALVVNILPAKAGDRRHAGLIPGSGRSPRGGHGYPLQYSCPENPMDRGAWQVMVQSIGLQRVRHDRSDLAAAAGPQWLWCMRDFLF